MSCAAEEHRFPAQGFVCSVCHAKRSAVVKGDALPYAAWKLARESPVAGSPRSTTMLCVDTRTGHQYLVREYLPDVVEDAAARRRQFVETAKSLHTAALPGMRVFFPYTRGGRCYTVSEPVAGVALATLVTPGRASEPEASRWLEAIFRALHQLHTLPGAAGMAFHGDLKPADILVQGNSPGDAIELVHSLYLENLLAESPLTPEQAMALDVRAAGHIALELALGQNAARQSMAGAAPVSDLVLGAALDYILFPGSGQTPSAKQVLGHMELLRRAKATGSSAEYKLAHAASGSTRLKMLAREDTPAPAPVREAPRPATPPSPPPVPPRPAPGPTAPPQQPPFRPVTLPVAPPGPTAKGWRGFFGARGPARPPARPLPPARPGWGARHPILLTFFLLSLFLIGMTIRSCSSPPAETQSLSFSIAPNPAMRGQTVTLRWKAVGFATVRLNGNLVGQESAQSFAARKTSTYTLVATAKDGRQETRQVVLTVNSPPRPAPVSPLAEDIERKQPPVEAQPILEHTPAPANVPQLTPRTPVTPAPPDPEQVAAEVRGALDHWAQTMLTNDPAQEAACYAPQVDRFFLREHVDNVYIRSYMNAFRLNARFTSFSFSPPSVEMVDAETVRVTLVKHFTLALTNENREVTERSELHLKKMNGQWKITFERDHAM